MAQNLGPEYLVIEEGLHGRTTVFDDPIQPGRNGSVYLGPCLESHEPIDLVILLLGTNEMKRYFSLSAYDIAMGAGALVDVILKSDTGYQGGPPEVLLVAPPRLGKLGFLAEMFQGGVGKSEALAGYYRQVAVGCGCHFMDSGAFVKASEADGVHLDASEQVTLGELLAVRVRKILGPER
jgi:lysophospholipase L1-like esterase